MWCGLYKFGPACFVRPPKRKTIRSPLWKLDRLLARAFIILSKNWKICLKKKEKCGAGLTPFKYLFGEHLRKSQTVGSLWIFFGPFCRKNGRENFQVIYIFLFDLSSILLLRKWKSCHSGGVAWQHCGLLTTLFQRLYFWRKMIGLR